jgi:putative protein kinase ArgK-like GTPase of G3E family
MNEDQLNIPIGLAFKGIKGLTDTISNRQNLKSMQRESDRRQRRSRRRQRQDQRFITRQERKRDRDTLKRKVFEKKCKEEVIKYSLISAGIGLIAGYFIGKKL